MGRMYPEIACPMTEEINNLIRSSTTFIIHGLKDSHLPFSKDLLAHITTLVYINTEKNIVYYTCSPTRFPNIKEIILLNTHPCEHCVLLRFKSVIWKTNQRYYIFEDMKEEISIEYDNDRKELTNTYYNDKERLIFYNKEWMSVEKYSSIQAQFWAGVLYLQQNERSKEMREAKNNEEESLI
jgi:hypothetical protein